MVVVVVVVVVVMVVVVVSGPQTDQMNQHTNHMEQHRTGAHRQASNSNVQRPFSIIFVCKSGYASNIAIAVLVVGSIFIHSSCLKGYKQLHLYCTKNENKRDM